MANRTPEPHTKGAGDATFVGLDVHKRWINGAVLLPGNDAPVEWQIVNETYHFHTERKRRGAETSFCVIEST